MLKQKYRKREMFTPLCPPNMTPEQRIRTTKLMVMCKSSILSDDSFLVFFKARNLNVFTIFDVVLYSYEFHTIETQPDLFYFYFILFYKIRHTLE